MLILLYFAVAAALGAAATAPGTMLATSPTAVGLAQAIGGTFMGLLVAAILASLYVELRMVREGADDDTLASIFS